MNITDRHEMTGKDQNQSEGKVASDLLTHISSPQSQFDQYSIIYDSVVFNRWRPIVLRVRRAHPLSDRLVMRCGFFKYIYRGRGYVIYHTLSRSMQYYIYLISSFVIETRSDFIT